MAENNWVTAVISHFTPTSGVITGPLLITGDFGAHLVDGKYIPMGSYGILWAILWDDIPTNTWIGIPQKTGSYGKVMNVHRIIPENTIRKFNIAPEKLWLEDYFPIGKVTFQGLC